MKLTLEPIEKFSAENSTVLIWAEKEKAFGTFPKVFANSASSIKGLLKKQSDKVLNDAFEYHNAANGSIALSQLPIRKGLPRDDRFRLAGSKTLDLQKNRSLEKLFVSVDLLSPEDFKAIAEGILISGYDFRKYKSEKKSAKGKDGKSESDVKPVTNFEIIFLTSAKKINACKVALAEAELICKQINFCRDLVNEPGSVLDPEVFTEQAKKVAKEYGLAIHIRDEKKLLAEGFTGLWTVGKGSDRPPRMVTLSYNADGKNSAKKTSKKKIHPHLCLVGKGITFDTGGISIKPSQGMWEMKCDMAGAGSVIAAICAIAALKLPIRVTAILCIAENRPGNAAVLPGDIFTAKNGKTIMVDNTDAEGRLVLTDGLAEAGNLGATHIIDLATLTGAIVRALGPSIAGLFSNDAAFGKTILKAGDKVSEKFCLLPLEEEYREYFDDPVADMKNVGKSEGGAITAALFLQEFVPEKTAWSHMDIAGTAFTTSNWKYFKPGGTGWGVKTLIETARILSQG